MTVIMVGGIASEACADSGSLPTPDEVLARMVASSKVIPASAKATYVTRNIIAPRSPVDIEREVDADLSEMQKGLARVGNDSALRSFEAQREKMRKQMLERRARTESIAVESYWMSDGKVRKDHCLLRSIDAGNVSSLKTLAESTKPVAQAEMSIFWDGVKTQQYHHVDHGAAAGARPTDQLFISKAKPTGLDFYHLGRSVPDGLNLDILRKQGLQVTVEETRSPEGEAALLLRLGEKNSIGFVAEIVVLPQYGYIQREVVMKLGGAVVSREAYSGYVEVAAGIWAPTEISREAYRVSATGVPEQSSKLQMVSIGHPEFNVDIADSVFSIKLVRDTTIKREDGAYVWVQADDVNAPMSLAHVLDSFAASRQPSTGRSGDVDQPGGTAPASRPGVVSQWDEKEHNRRVIIRTAMYAALLFGFVVLGVIGWRIFVRRRDIRRKS